MLSNLTSVHHLRLLQNQLLVGGPPTIKPQSSILHFSFRLHIFSEQILNDNELDLFLTQRMREMLFPKRAENEYLSVLLEEWGANPEQIPAIISWVHKNENAYGKPLKIITRQRVRRL